MLDGGGDGLYADSSGLNLGKDATMHKPAAFALEEMGRRLQGQDGLQ